MQFEHNLGNDDLGSLVFAGVEVASWYLGSYYGRIELL